MTVEMEAAASFANANVDDPLFETLFTASVSSVDDYLGFNGVSRCPEATYDLAVMLTFRRVWDIYRTKNGMVQFGPDGEATFLPADILKPAIPIIRRYRGIGAVG